MSLRNWDNKTWLSSKKYIKSFNNFILKHVNLSKNSQILDIGCGRGKILGNLSTKLRLKKKPIGIDIEKHIDRDLRIRFKKVDAISFFAHNKKKFDFILVKQTIHFFSLYNIKKLINCCRKNLNPNGTILVFTLDPYNNEIPSFRLMKKKLNKSLQRDKIILKLLFELNFIKVPKKFIYKVKITKKKYVKMIQSKFISILLPFKEKEIFNGIKEINATFNNIIRFNDNLVCIILKK